MITFQVSTSDGDELTVGWVFDGKTMVTGKTLDCKKLKSGMRVVAAAAGCARPWLE